jgi:hypothetical protein
MKFKNSIQFKIRPIKKSQRTKNDLLGIIRKLLEILENSTYRF